MKGNVKDFIYFKYLLTDSEYNCFVFRVLKIQSFSTNAQKIKYLRARF